MAAALRGALPGRASTASRPTPSGITGVIVKLGPFGGAQKAGPWLWVWTVAYLALIGAGARAGFARRDL